MKRRLVLKLLRENPAMEFDRVQAVQTARLKARFIRLAQASGDEQLWWRVALFSCGQQMRAAIAAQPPARPTRTARPSDASMPAGPAA